MWGAQNAKMEIGRTVPLIVTHSPFVLSACFPERKGARIKG